MLQILNRKDGGLIYEKDVLTMKDCVESALSERVDLINADLSNQDLDTCVLFRGNCTFADLSGASLVDVSFEQCNLFGADLANCDLRGADLTRANLAGVTLTQPQIDSLGVGLSEYQRAQVTVIS